MGWDGDGNGMEMGIEWDGDRDGDWARASFPPHCSLRAAHGGNLKRQSRNCGDRVFPPLFTTVRQ